MPNGLAMCSAGLQSRNFRVRYKISLEVQPLISRLLPALRIAHVPVAQLSNKDTQNLGKDMVIL